MSRTRLMVYVRDDMAARIEAIAELKGLSRSSLIATALECYVGPSGAEERHVALSQRLDHLSLQFSKLEQDQIIAIETLALFVRYFLSVSEAIPEAKQDSARAQGRARFDQFVHQLARHLQRGRSLVRDLHDEIYPGEGEIFGPASGAIAPGAGGEA